MTALPVRHECYIGISRSTWPRFTPRTELAGDRIHERGSGLERSADFADSWGKFPAIVRLGEDAREEYTPFLRFDSKIRRIVCTTDVIKSVNARFRRAVKVRGHFLSGTVALKCVYMAIMSLDATGKGQAAGPCAGRLH
ncbi:transposase [Streptomyces sp. NPDC006539]|uniref:transposase n=1 Tax=Streptomyces sp. NPDC006539 TaxID=3155352 RepID=UPI0033A6FDD0